MATCDFCNASIPAGSKACPKCGAALRTDDTADAGKTSPAATEGNIASLLRQGRKIKAIKLYREQTGVGLAEAKAAVEAMERGAPLPPGPDAPAPEDVDGALWELLKKGQKIEAIKRYREQTGVGLAEAKAAVEAIASQHGIPMKSAGCASMIVVGIVGVITIIEWCCG
jgi:ribosomal protein L7/L12